MIFDLFWNLYSLKSFLTFSFRLFLMKNYSSVVCVFLLFLQIIHFLSFNFFSFNNTLGLIRVYRLWVFFFWQFRAFTCPSFSTIIWSVSTEANLGRLFVSGRPILAHDPQKSYPTRHIQGVPLLFRNVIGYHLQKAFSSFDQLLLKFLCQRGFFQRHISLRHDRCRNLLGPNVHSILFVPTF